LFYIGQIIDRQPILGDINNVDENLAPKISGCEECEKEGTD